MLKPENIHKKGLRDTKKINGESKHIIDPNQWGEFRHIALAHCIYSMSVPEYHGLSRDAVDKRQREHFALTIGKKFPKATHVFEYRLVSISRKSIIVECCLVGNVYENPYVKEPT